MTLFPQLCDTVLSQSIIGRARQAGRLTVCCHNIRDYSDDPKYRRVDDTPYGGGMGMVMQPEPIFRCYEEVLRQNGGVRPHVIYLSPQGAVLTQQRALELSRMEGLTLLCGHYEGVDERILEEIVDEEISIGDYVLTGGELPAMVLVDTVGRLCPGVLSDDLCFEEESHFSGLLEYPQYTRPPLWRGRAVPEVLQSGHHARIQQWRREKSLDRTRRKRPDMLAWAELSDEDLRLLQEMEGQGADDSVKRLWARFIRFNRRCRRRGYTVRPLREMGADGEAGPIMRGVKRAFVSPLAVYEQRGQSVLRPGELSVLLDGCGEALCIVEAVSAAVLPLSEVTGEWIEMERGTACPREQWTEERRALFQKAYAAEKIELSGDIPVVCEEFRVLMRRAGPVKEGELPGEAL